MFLRNNFENSFAFLIIAKKKKQKIKKMDSDEEGGASFQETSDDIGVNFLAIFRDSLDTLRKYLFFFFIYFFKKNFFFFCL